jgi:ribonuclease P protein component
VLPKQHRLPIVSFSPRARTLFRGKAVVAKLVGNKLGILRVGVLFRRKIVGGAATRNTVKRFVLDRFAQEVKKHIGEGTDLLIIIVAPIIKLDLSTRVGLAEELTLVKSTLISKDR